jgi:hypothetical protein
MIVTALMACRLARWSGRRRISKSSRHRGGIYTWPRTGLWLQEDGGGRRSVVSPSYLRRIACWSWAWRSTEGRRDLKFLSLFGIAVAYTRRRPHNQHFNGSMETLMPTRATLYKSMNSDSKIEIPVCSGNGSPLVSYGKETSCYRSLG